jgi:uncharacterized protein YjbI with pentapeptide repeats
LAWNAEEALLAVHFHIAELTKQVSRLELESEYAFGVWISRVKGMSGRMVWLGFLDLSGYQLYLLNFYGANVTKSNFKDVNLQFSIFAEADLQGISFENGMLSDVDLHCANLREANLRNADLYLANLQGANLEGANLEGAKLKGTILTGTILEKKEG